MSFKGFDDVGPKEEHSEFEPKTSKKAPREKLLKTAMANRKVDPGMNLPRDARLAPQESPSKVKLCIDGSGHCQVLPTEPKSSPDLSGKPVQEQESPDKKVAETPLNLETLPPEHRLSKLEEFQTKQKMIEEQNRKRKEMLVEAINSRRKQTDKESKKLELVQQELAKIDVMLTTDVRFLRASIEHASLEFMEAQKRYDRAEKEFVDAKLHLFSTLERKELLTDHLCAIIEQNELRKARKLEELMFELSLKSQTESTSPAQSLVTLTELREVQEFNTIKK